MRIAVGADHAGIGLKAAIKSRLEELGHQVDDKGAFSTESTDYPDYAALVAKDLQAGRADRGVLICGTGLGMCMTANRFHGVRGVVAPRVDYARLGRRHNGANLLCLGARFTATEDALAILEAFMTTDFEGGRHQRRVDKVEAVSGG